MNTKSKDARPRQVRTLAWCGERSPMMAELLGFSPKTVKRLYRQTAAEVAVGRPLGVPARWFGRERESLRAFLQTGLTEGLPKILAGEAPYLLMELAAACGLESPAQVGAVLRRVHVGIGKGENGAVQVEARQCPTCGCRYLGFLRTERRELKELTCPDPACRRQFSRRATQRADLHGRIYARQERPWS
jgi:hypothetical protein